MASLGASPESVSAACSPRLNLTRSLRSRRASAQNTAAARPNPLPCSTGHLRGSANSRCNFQHRRRENCVIGAPLLLHGHQHRRRLRHADDLFRLRPARRRLRPRRAMLRFRPLPRRRLQLATTTAATGPTSFSAAPAPPAAPTTSASTAPSTKTWRSTTSPDGSINAPRGVRGGGYALSSARPSSRPHRRRRRLSTASTIFHKSRTPLRLWFQAIFRLSSTRCRIPAKTLERDDRTPFARPPLMRVQRVAEPPSARRRQPGRASPGCCAGAACCTRSASPRAAPAPRAGCRTARRPGTRRATGR